MPNLNTKYGVHLTAEQREAICRRQSVAAAKVRRATILLLADEDHPEGRRRDWQIAEAVGLSERQVVRIRQQFVREGDPALDRKQRSDAGVPKVPDGKAEATLVTLCCSDPPEGRDRWTLQLLCDELGRLEVVESVCCATVRQCLKENRLQPWRTERFCIPEADRARFVARMEEVLDVYQQTYDRQHPLICMDEASRQIHSDRVEPLPMRPGCPRLGTLRSPQRRRGTASHRRRSSRPLEAAGRPRERGS